MPIARWDLKQEVESRLGWRPVSDADDGFQRRKYGPHVHLHSILYAEAGAYVTIRKKRRLTRSDQLQQRKIVFINMRTSTKKERQLALSSSSDTINYTQDVSLKMATWMAMKRAQRERQSRQMSVMEIANISCNAR